MATDVAISDRDAGNRDRLVNAVPFFYGWVMLAVSMIAQFATSPGQTYGISVFNKHLATSLDLNLTTIAAAYMWGTILACLPMSLVGAMADKYGLRRTMALIVTLFAIACFGMSMVRGPYSLFCGFLAMRMFGQGSLSLLAGTTLDMWFRDKLGFAAGIRNLSIPISLAIYPILTFNLIVWLGWRETFIFLALGLCLLMYPILIFIFRNKPEDVGLLPDGTRTVENQELNQAGIHLKGLDFPQLTLGEAMQTRVYWILITLGFNWGMIATALMFMIVPYLELQGLTENDARWIFISLASSMAVFQFFGGYLADRLPLKLLMGIGTLGMGLSVALYGMIQSVSGEIIYGMVFGASQGMAAAGASPMWARFFGRAHLGKIKGTSMTAMVAGSSIGPYLMSKGHDLFASHQPCLVLFFILFVVQGLVAFFADPPVERVVILDEAEQSAAAG